MLIPVSSCIGAQLGRGREFPPGIRANFVLSGRSRPCNIATRSRRRSFWAGVSAGGRWYEGGSGKAVADTTRSHKSRSPATPMHIFMNEEATLLSPCSLFQKKKKRHWKGNRFYKANIVWERESARSWLLTDYYLLKEN